MHAVVAPALRMKDFLRRRQRIAAREASACQSGAVPEPQLKRKEKPMADKIKAGSILIEEGTFLPESLRFESEPYSNGWRLVRNLDGYGLERKIRLAGWNFFYMAGEIKASVFGFDTEKVIHRAIKRVLADLKADKFNSVEIGQVAADGFLGLRHVTVSAHPRHIQESVSLFHDKRLAERDRAKLVAV
jgi:hypothetical protein